MVSPITLMRRPSVLLADRHGHGDAGVDDLDAAGEAVGGVHGDGAHLVVAEVLLHLADDLAGLPVAAVDARP